MPAFDTQLLVLVASTWALACGVSIACVEPLCYILALSRTRIISTPGSVRLTTLDVQTTFRSGILLLVVAPASLLFWWVPFGVCGVLLILIWLFGSTLEFLVTPNSTQVRRRFLAIPFQTQTFDDRPRALLTGWGDVLDPECFCLEIGPEVFELAWVTRERSGQPWVDEFNRQVSLQLMQQTGSLPG
jgi:hypothetical protein